MEPWADLEDLARRKGTEAPGYAVKKRPAPRFLEVTHLRVLSDLFKGLVTSIWGINPTWNHLAACVFLLRSCPLQFLFRLPLVFEYILKFVGESQVENHNGLSIGEFADETRRGEGIFMVVPLTRHHFQYLGAH